MTKRKVMSLSVSPEFIMLMEVLDDKFEHKLPRSKIIELMVLSGMSKSENNTFADVKPILQAIRKQQERFLHGLVPAETMSEALYHARFKKNLQTMLICRADENYIIKWIKQCFNVVCLTYDYPEKVIKKCLQACGDLCLDSPKLMEQISEVWKNDRMLVKSEQAMQ